MEHCMVWKEKHLARQEAWVRNKWWVVWVMYLRSIRTWLCSWLYYSELPTPQSPRLNAILPASSITLWLHRLLSPEFHCGSHRGLFPCRSHWCDPSARSEKTSLCLHETPSEQGQGRGKEHHFLSLPPCPCPAPERMLQAATTQQPIDRSNVIPGSSQHKFSIPAKLTYSTSLKCFSHFPGLFFF